MKTKKIQIKNLKIGDKIKTTNSLDGITEFKTVTDTWVSKVEKDNQRNVVLENGVNIKCSNKHPFMCSQNDQIIEVFPDDLTVEHNIISDIGITKIVFVKPDETERKYIDITVEDLHTFFVSDNNDSAMVLTHNSQGGVRGGSMTSHYLLWHLEIEDLLVLKNNKGTPDSRVRKMDYAVEINDYLYRRFVKKQNITLFSPHEVKDLYDAFYSDQVLFAELYEKYEQDDSKKKKVISAAKLFTQLTIERKETARIYIFNVDNVNEYKPFKIPVTTSNLCLTGDTKVKCLLGDIPYEINLFRLNELFEENKTEISILSKNIENGEISYNKVKNSGLIKKNAKLVKITDTITGKYIKCTPEHKIYTKNRGYVEAKFLSETDELDIS